MIRILSVLFCFCYFLTIVAQSKYDYNWVICSESHGNYEGTEGEIFRFTEEGLVIDSLVEAEVDMFRQAATMSDAAGNLLFYTDACGIYNREHQIMQNGWGINEVTDIYEDRCPGGYPWEGNLMVVPDPASEKGYYVIHKSVTRINNPPQIYCEDLLYSYVDMELDNGLGAVTDKNVILEDSITYKMGHLQTTRHANGKDWWFTQVRIFSNVHYKYLIDDSGITLIDSQAVGPIYNLEEGVATQVTFSRDGNYYYTHGNDAGLLRYAFDRSTGDISYIDSTSISNQYSWRYLGISPNDRFLYAATDDSLYQIDLEAPTMAEGTVLIDTFDGFRYFNVPVLFGNFTPGPDCKLYMGTPAGIPFMHTIHAPDEKGQACDFRQRDILLPFSAPPSYKFVLPFYRTGEDAPCDPNLVGLYDAFLPYQPAYDIYPNPTADILRVISPDRSIISAFFIYDIHGNRIARSQVGHYKLELDMQAYAAGVYILQLYDRDGVMWSERVVRM